MKKYLLSGLLLSVLVVPGFASAQTAATTTPEQSFTLCQQASIEARDTALGTARTAYNTAMSSALSARKDAEKGAVALTDLAAKKAAIKVAADAYKVSVTNAQNTLKSARVSVLATFETDVKNCRDQRFSGHALEVTAKKGEIQTLQTERKAAVEAKQAEVQTIRESFRAQIDALRSFFKGKASTE